MWHYSDQRFRQMPQTVPAGPQSAHDLLLGMRGMAITFLFLDLSEPSKPVAQVPGLIEEITSSEVTVTLAAPLPPLPAGTRFGVEVLTGSGILRFQSTAVTGPEVGATQVNLHLPYQVESVQRRKYSRVKLSGQVIFAPGVAEQPEGILPPGGMAQAVDLSAGGMRFFTTMPGLRYGHRLYLSFSTPDGGTHRGLEAKVVRVESQGSQHVVAVQFVNMPPELEDELVQIVFRLQLRGPVKR